MDNRDPAGRPLEYSDNEKLATRRWLEHWRTVGPLLAAERWARLAARSDADLLQDSRDLLSFWRPEFTGDAGEALVIQQRVFARMRAREPR
jgi:hypothetical protein